MKKLTRLIIAEIFMFFLLAAVVVTGQSALTLGPTGEQIREHLDDAQKTVDKFKANEKTASESLIRILQSKADIMAYLLREEEGSLTKKALSEYAEILGADAIHVVSTQNGQIHISSKGSTGVLPEIRGTGAEIDDESMVAVELNIDEETELFNDSMSWEDAIVNTIVGRNGYVFVANKEDNRVVAHPDGDLVGTKAKFTAGDPQDYTNSFGLVEVGEDVLCASLIEIKNEDYYDEYVICGIPVTEIFQEAFWNILIFLLVFLVITVLRICYLIFSFGQNAGRTADPLFGRKLVLYSLLGMGIVFFITIFLTRLNMVSDYSVSCRSRALNAVNTMDEYEEDIARLQELYNKEYLIKCRMAADILSRHKELNTREDLQRMAEILNVEEIYVFDRNGKVAVTNSPYDHFELSRDKNSQSYDFRPLLEGVEYVIQEPRENDVSGEWMQYIGVSVRDENDLANGFVQIAIAPKEFQKIVKSINLSARLNEISIVNSGFAFAADGDSGEILYAPKKRYVGKNAAELGILPSQLQDGYNGYITINDDPYFASVEENDNGLLVFVVIPKRDMRSEQWKAAVVTALMTLICMLLLIRIAVSEDGKRQQKSVAEKSGTGTDSAVDLDDGAATGASVSKVTDRITAGLKVFQDQWLADKSSKSEERWGRVFLSWQDRSPEEKVLSLIKLILFCISLGVAWVYFFGGAVLHADSILLYIIEGDWEKGINIFAATACIMILCVIFIVVEIIEHILYTIVLMSDTKTETVCHLLRSLVRYGAVIIGLYYCLAQFGVNTRTLAASAGILSVVIGFGAQELVKDIIAGLFIIFEDQFAVGDLIMVDGWLGYVTEIGIRATKVSFYDDVKSFNNSDIRGIENYSVKDIVVANREIGIGYDEDLQRVYKVFERELPLMKDRIIGAEDKPRLFGIVRLEDSAVILRFELPCKADMRLKAEAAFYRELLLMFERNGIEVPYPHISLTNEEAAVKSPDA